MLKKTSTYLEIFLVSLKLGLTSFGGPTAHIGYFRREYVEHRKWLDERKFTDLVALCQMLPGPASSQVGMGIGMIRAGIRGGILAFLGFTLPSAIILGGFALSYRAEDVSEIGWLHGLKIVAVVVVLQAVIGMGKNFANHRTTASIAALSAATALLLSSNLTQIVILVGAGLAGYFLLASESTLKRENPLVSIKKSTGLVALTVFFLLLAVLPFLASTGSQSLALFDRFYRSGAFVFGGGHVVLPLLEQEFVKSGMISRDAFLIGYGAAQSVPGPLFTFAAYIGAIHSGVFGAILATIAIFLPAFLLILGVLPFWYSLASYPSINRTLQGINAAVVGILFAALYDPIFTTTIQSSSSLVVAIVLFVLLEFWRMPPWVIVLLGAVVGGIFL